MDYKEYRTGSFSGGFVCRETTTGVVTVGIMSHEFYCLTCIMQQGFYLPYLAQENAKCTRRLQRTDPITAGEGLTGEVPCRRLM